MFQSSIAERLRRAGLVAYWPLATRTAVDLKSALSGNLGPHDLTNNNGVTRVAGPGGNLPNGVDFDAPSVQNLSIDNSAGIRLHPPFSFAFWVNPTDLTTQRFLLGKDSAGAGGREMFVLYKATTGLLRADLLDGTNLINSHQPVGVALTAGAWNFVVWTVTHANSKFVVNADPAKTDIDPWSGTIGKTATPLLIGGRSAGSVAFDGQMGPIAFWVGHALTDTEISWLYNNGQGRNLARAA